MLPAAAAKDARIEFKTSREIKTLLQNAAQSMGMDLSSFLISTTIEKARKIIREERMLTLSSREWKAFHDHLHTDTPPTDALRDLMRTEPFRE